MDIDGTWKRYTLRSMQVIHTFDMYFYGWMDGWMDDWLVGCVDLR